MVSNMHLRGTCNIVLKDKTLKKPKCQHPHQLAVHTEDMETKKQYWSVELVLILDEEKKSCDCLAHILVQTNVRKESFYKRKMLSGWGLTNVFGKFNSDGVFRLFVQSNRLQVIFRWKPAMWSLKPTPDCMTVWRTTDKSWAGLSFHRQVADNATGHSWPVCDFCRLFIVWK